MLPDPFSDDQRPKLNLSHLAVFQVVAERGGIRAAARQLGYTQPAVTYVIRELERSVGAELLHRGSKGVVLTELGMALYRRAQLLLAEMRRTEDELAQLREGLGGSLCVAFSSVAAMRVMVPTLNKFRRLRPGVKLELHEITTIGWKQPWQNGIYDLAVISELDDVDADDGLQRQLLFTSPMVVTARENHPLLHATSLRELHASSWVLPGYGPALMARLMQRLGLPAPHDVILSQSLQFSLSILRGSDALSLYSNTLHDDPVSYAGLTRIPVVEALPWLNVSLVLRNPASLTPAAKMFVQCLMEQAQGQRTVLTAEGY